VWFACNGVAVHAVSRAPLNMALDINVEIRSKVSELERVVNEAQGRNPVEG